MCFLNSDCKKSEMVQEQVDDSIHEKALHIIEKFFGEHEIGG